MRFLAARTTLLRAERSRPIAGSRARPWQGEAASRVGVRVKLYRRLSYAPAISTDIRKNGVSFVYYYFLFGSFSILFCCIFIFLFRGCERVKYESKGRRDRSPSDTLLQNRPLGFREETTDAPPWSGAATRPAPDVNHAVVAFSV